MKFIKKHWFPILIGIIVIVAIVLLRRRTTSGNAGSGSITSGPFAPSSSAGNLDEGKLLSQGSTGPEVAELQRLINSGYQVAGVEKSISTDGIFGPITANALNELTSRFQITLSDARFMLSQYS